MNIPKELGRVRRAAHPTQGLPSDNNHDPSNILFYNGKYYLWYTQHVHDLPYGHYTGCKIMCVTSADGENWDEPFDALLPGEPGSWDAGGVLTANVIFAEGKYYMWYSGVGENYSDEAPQPRSCSWAVADTPDGPFVRKSGGPAFGPGAPGEWDDFGVDDITALFWNGEWRIYYKGSNSREHDADMTQLGFARAPSIEGPYRRDPHSPVIRGHAFSLWPYKGGLLLLSGLKHKAQEGYIYRGNWHDPTGHQYLYYSEDGVCFEPCCEFENRASGIFVPQGAAADDISSMWGVAVNTRSSHFERYIERFDFEVGGE